MTAAGARPVALDGRLVGRYPTFTASVLVANTAVLPGVGADDNHQDWLTTQTCPATATLALQHQLVSRDLPRLADALEPVLGRRPTYAVLKGRHNYVCLDRLNRGATDREDSDDDASTDSADSDDANKAAHKRMQRWTKGTDIFIALFPNQTWDDLTAAAKAVQEAGFNAVPHVPCRRIKDAAEVAEIDDKWTGLAANVLIAPVIAPMMWLALGVWAATPIEPRFAAAAADEAMQMAGLEGPVANPYRAACIVGSGAGLWRAISRPKHG